MKKVLCVALCLLFLCGCGKEAAYTPTGDALEYDEDYTGATVPPKKQEEQSLTMIYYPGETMNPYDCTDFSNQALFSLLYQGLFTVDRDYNVEPVLCRQYAVSEDMRTYVFSLEDALFSDGSPLTPEDVVASYNAARSTDVYQGRFTHIQGVSVSEGNAVSFYLDCPVENLPLLLDVPIVPAGQVSDPWPAGTGPYRYGETATGVCLERRTDWWCTSDLGVTASVITLMEAESPTQIRDRFQFGGVDLVCADPGSDKYADYRCDYELWDMENGIFLYIAFSGSSAAFEDPELRAAITYAVDRDTIAATEYRGFARGASLPASPLFPQYSPSLASRFSYDPERFAQIVQSRNAVGTPLVFLVNSDDSLRLRVARSIAASLNNGGLQVSLSALGGRDYQNAIRNRAFDLYLGQTRLSPNMDLSEFFDFSGALSIGGVNEIGAYTLCKEALANHGNYYTLYKAVMEKGLLCPVLFRSYSIYATRGLLTGLTPSRDGVFHYSVGKTMEQANVS